MAKKVLIVIRHRDVGGADKRLLTIFKELLRRGHDNELYLLINSELKKKIAEHSEIASLLRKTKNIYYYEGNDNSIFAYRKIIKKRLKEIQPDIVHFVLAHPLLYHPRKYKIFYTYPMTNLGQLHIFGRIAVLTGILLSDKIDILNPEIFKKLKKYFWFKKDKIHLTPGSFVDLEYYSPNSNLQRKNQIVFLGRFEFMKQPIELLEQLKLALPEIEAKGFTDVEIHMVGRGTLAQQVISYSHDEIIGNKLKVYTSSNPREILTTAKIFLSVQKFSNYPSKSLLEAIACGVIPVVTRNDDVELITHPSFAFLINEKLNFKEFVPIILDIFEMSTESYDERVRNGREFLKENFSLQKNLLYFTDFYELRQKNNDKHSRHHLG